MPSAVTCGDCGAQFEVTQQLWDDRIEGRVVQVRCKRCGAKIQMDGRDPGAAPKHSKPPPPSVREKLTSVVDVEPQAVREETPTVPLTKPGQLPRVADALTPTPSSPKAGASSGASDVWLVSYDEDDDRELSHADVVKAFAAKEIHAETLAWQDGMDEWLSLNEIGAFSSLFKPELATAPLGKSPAPASGLGVGASSGERKSPAPPAAQAPEPAEEEAPISLAPESLPPESMDPDSLEDIVSSSGGVTALSPGTLMESRSETQAKPKPAPPRRAQAPAEPKAPVAAAPAAESRLKRLPKPPPAPPRTQADFLVAESNPKAAPKPIRPPANLKRPDTVAFEAEGPAPDSIPNVAKLSQAPGPADNAATRDAARKQHDDEELLRIHATGFSDDVGLGVVDNDVGPPTIDLAGLDAGDSTSAASEAAPQSSSGKRKSKRSPQSVRPGAAPAMPSDAPVSHTTPAPSQARPVSGTPSDEQPSRAPLFIAVGVAAAIAVYWFGIRTPEVTATAGNPDPVVEQARSEATSPQVLPNPEPTTPEPAAEPSAAELAADPAPEKPVPTGNGASPTAATPGARTPTGAQPVAPQPADPTGKPAAGATAPAPPTAVPTATAAAAPAEPAGEFDVGAARAALNSAAGQASACRKDGDPSGVAHVTITFAPSGRATSANIGGPPFAGTATGGCIASTMRRARVPAFAGGHKTVSKTVVIQ